MTTLIRMIRVDHWFKNIFILPGFVIAVALLGKSVGDYWWNGCLAVFSACLAASANYLINEYVDSKFDAHHPVKKDRAAVQANVPIIQVILAYTFLVGGSVGIANQVNRGVVWAIVSFLLAGILYNLKPIRLKDKAFTDVLCESINNPIRLCIGWFAVTSQLWPPSSLIMGYWMAGAFLMGVKRYSEYKNLGAETAGKYRRSFKFYTEESLLISSFFYALCASFFLGVFLVKYKVELIFSLPFLAVLFAWYLKIGMKPDSAAQRPEKLYRETWFFVYCVLLSVLVVVLFMTETEWMNYFLRNAFVNNG